MFNWTGAEQLPELTLENNQLTSLPAEIFDTLWGLKTLNLNHNRLQVLKVGVFSKLRNLKFLDIKDNQLAILPAGLFAFQNKLVYLDLRNNLLETVDVEVIAPMSSLNTLCIKGNPLMCDCRLQPLVIWSSWAVENIDAECHSPPPYRGFHWSVLASVFCPSLDSIVSTTPSTYRTTNIEINLSTSVIDGYTEVLSTNGTQPEDMQHGVNLFLADNVTLVALGLVCLLALTVILIFVFWFNRLKVRRSPTIRSSEEENELHVQYDDIDPDGHYECIEAGRKDGKNCITDSKSDTVRYVSGP
jgi:hypothetical protein